MCWCHVCTCVQACVCVCVWACVCVGMCVCVCVVFVCGVCVVCVWCVCVQICICLCISICCLNISVEEFVSSQGHHTKVTKCSLLILHSCNIKWQDQNNNKLFRFKSTQQHQHPSYCYNILQLLSKNTNLIASCMPFTGNAVIAPVWTMQIKWGCKYIRVNIQ